jgi:hypothetical protein
MALNGVAFQTGLATGPARAVAVTSIRQPETT